MTVYYKVPCKSRPYAIETDDYDELERSLDYQEIEVAGADIIFDKYLKGIVPLEKKEEATEALLKMIIDIHLCDNLEDNLEEEITEYYKEETLENFCGFEYDNYY